MSCTPIYQQANWGKKGQSRDFSNVNVSLKLLLKRRCVIQNASYYLPSFLKRKSLKVLFQMSLQQFCMKLLHAHFYCKIWLQERNKSLVYIKAYFAQMVLWNRALKWEKKKIVLNHLQEVGSCKRLVSLPSILLQLVLFCVGCVQLYHITYITIWY